MSKYVTKSIPHFPNFKPLEFSDKTAIETITKNYAPYSDFNFLSLWCYNNSEDTAISNLNNNLVIKLHDYISQNIHLSFLGKSQVDKTIITLLSYAKDTHITPVLKFIPESVISTTKVNKKLNVLEDKDHFDYVLSIDQLQNLFGPKYISKRRLVTKFKKKYTHITLRFLEMRDKKTQKDIISLFTSWGKIKNKIPAETEHELMAILRLIQYSKFFNLVITGAYDKDKMVGFTIDELVHNNYVLGHFSKADIFYKGIYEILIQFSASELISRGFIYKNIEQDMGLIGLRKAKQLWRPIHFLKKYTISRNI